MKYIIYSKIGGVKFLEYSSKEEAIRVLSTLEYKEDYEIVEDDSENSELPLWDFENKYDPLIPIEETEFSNNIKLLLLTVSVIVVSYILFGPMVAILTTTIGIGTLVGHFWVKIANSLFGRK